MNATQSLETKLSGAIKMDPESQLPANVRDDFDDLAFLGRGGQGLTFRGTRKSDHKEVVLKVLDFLELSSWKNYDLFLREIAILKNLNHPAIPKVLGVFPETPQENEPEAVILIQEYFDGDSLKVLLDASDNEPWSEEKILRFLEEMLEILSYLHGLNPPVVHRDIKPSNIIRRQDGTSALIDFGAASSTQKTNASTFVGTNGYMAPEQMMGRAEPRSDLYSLGATALHLATGIHPNDLAREDFSFRFEGFGLSPGLVRVLEKMVHPLPEKRFQDSRQARQHLHPSQELVLATVSEHGFKLVRQDAETKIELPGPPRFFIFAPMIVAVVGALALLFEGSSFSSYYNIFLMGGWSFYSIVQRRHVAIDDQSINYVRKFGPFSHSKTWALSEITDIRSHSLGLLVQVVLQDRNAKKQSLGSFSGEQSQWLVRNLLEDLKARQ